MPGAELAPGMASTLGSINRKGRVFFSEPISRLDAPMFKFGEGAARVRALASHWRGLRTLPRTASLAVASPSAHWRAPSPPTRMRSWSSEGRFLFPQGPALSRL